MSLPIAAPFMGWSPMRFEAVTENGAWTGGRVTQNAAYFLDVTSVGVQFGQSVFEGMTARLGENGQVILFRVADHYERLKASCERLAIPAPPFELFERGLHEALALRTQFDTPLSSKVVYIRPLVIGTTPHIMPILSKEYLFSVTVAPYFFAAFPDRLKLKIEHKYRRTAEQGLGSAKTASNYAHLYAPTKKANHEGYDSLVWLDSGSSERISEASSMNVFFATTHGLFTPSLNEHLLPGITRDSALRIAREQLGLSVFEMPVMIGDVEAWHRAGELEAMFITSTARGVRPVSTVNLSGADINFDVSNDSCCQAIASSLNGIKDGTSDDPYGWRSIRTLHA